MAGIEVITPNFGELLAGIAAVLTAFFGGIKLMMNSSTKSIHTKMDRAQRENLEQHDKIFKTLTIVEDSITRKEIIEELRTIVRGYIHYNKIINSNAKVLIDAQCERVVELTEEMMTERLSQDKLEQLSVKVEATCIKARQQVLDLYGEEFLKHYIVLQRTAVEDFISKVTQLTADNIINSKYARFKSAAMGFLHELVSETLLLIHKWEKDHGKEPGK